MRTATAALVLGLAVAGAPVVQPALVAPAHAQDTNPLFNKDAKGSITIKESVNGVTYELFQVKKFDFVEDLVAAADITVHSALASADTAQETITGNGSDQAFSNLDVGLYLVKPSHAVHAFLAMIPSTDPDNRNTFVYDLQVEPKPKVDATEKKVVGENGDEVTLSANAGQDIHYQITSSIPKNPNEELYQDNYLAKYEVVDALDTVNLDYKSVKVVVNGQEMSPVDDYTVEGTVTVEMTENGMKKLAAPRLVTTMHS